MRRRGKPLEVSTFPFLAVLLCAMGSLILVLIVMDRKAKMAARYKVQAAQTQANEELAKADAARRDKLRQQEAEAQAAYEHKRDELHTNVVSQEQVVQAQIKQVQDQLSAAAARLKAELDERETLTHGVEAEKKRVVGEEQALATIRKDLAQVAAQTSADRAAQAKMTADLAQLETALKNLKEARERDRQTFSVVPYHGKHGESRRPLYVECTRNGVIFHPDRVEMTLVNAVAARTEVERRIKVQREYQTSIQAKTEEKPYLMLLVRPDGITSYYQIQSALHGVELEFGYEFVDADWLFDFSKEEEHAAPAAAVVTAPAKAVPVVVGSGPLVAVGPPIAETPTISVVPGGSSSDVKSSPPTLLPEGASGPAIGPAPGNPPTTAPVGAGVPSSAPPPPNVGPAAVAGRGGNAPRIDPPYRPAKSHTDFATASDHQAGAGNSPSPSGPQLAPGVEGAKPTKPAGAPSSGDPPPDTGPRFAPPQTPPKKQPQPPSLKVAKLNGDRDYLIFVECRPDEVVLYPSRQTYPVSGLGHGDQALVQAIKQMIERKQALVRPGELPFRPQVRFLVRPEGIRGYHTTYPVLNALNVPQSRQNLDADDDVTAIVTGQ